jgi:hypothetical protein
MARSRVFEYTDRTVSTRFSQGGDIDFDQLARLPCLFMEEGTGDEVARVGWISRPRLLIGSDVAFDCAFDPDVPPIPNSQIYANRGLLDMPKEFEFSRNHWAVKDVDLYRFLLSTVRPARQRPAVFKIEECERIDADLISVMMPFDAGFNAIYESIKMGVQGVGLRCMRADDMWEDHTIIQDIVSLIDRSRVVICDCTGRNPNVFYEAGIAHTLGRDVILITQNEGDIPFDLRHLRYVRYHNNGEGRAVLSTSLGKRLTTILGN